MVGKVSATVSESVPIETAHEDMIVSRKINYQSPGRSSLVRRFSTTPSWITTGNALRLARLIER